MIEAFLSFILIVLVFGFAAYGLLTGIDSGEVPSQQLWDSWLGRTPRSGA